MCPEAPADGFAPNLDWVEVADVITCDNFGDRLRGRICEVQGVENQQVIQNTA